MRISDLRTEHLSDPLGVGTATPRFTWTYRSGASEPAAWQILVASSEQSLASDQADLWDSGSLPTDGAWPIEYRGTSLKSRQRCFWAVRAIDRDGAMLAQSAPSHFEIALLDDADWSAAWIGLTAGPSGAIYFRREFAVDWPVEQARLYGVGLGWGEFWINGVRVGHSVLDPAQTDLSCRVLYSTYDVTSLLVEGRNVIGAIVGPGWSGRRALLAQLEVRGHDGTVARVTTGPEATSSDPWAVAAGPIVEASVYDGEHYDARLEHASWCLPAPDPQHPWGDMRDLRQAPVTDAPGGRLEPQSVEPIEVVETRAPVALSEPLPSVWVLDAGQNLAGWLRISAHGRRGDQVTMRFAEMCHPDGTVNQENLRGTARAEDRYIFRGGEKEAWEPRFTYHGFRYVQIEGLTTPPRLEDLEVRVVRSALIRTGRFDCSDELVRRIHRAVVWTEASNLHGMPTDCPQRGERMGWLNDMAVRTEELVHTYDASLLLAKWMKDIADTQDDHGAIADTAPFRYGNRPADPVGICFVLIPWLLHRHFGDVRTMTEHFDGMRRWVEYLAGRAVEDIVEYSYYGDWAPPLDQAMAGSHGSSAVSALTPGRLISTAHYAGAVKLLSQMAAVLGRDDAGELDTWASRVATSFHDEFWNKELGGYGVNNQACNAVALYFGLVPESAVASTVANLVRDVHQHDDHLTTGNLCTKYILEVLAEHGHGDTAYRIVTRTSYPSWGYMLDQGATTIWERWEHETGDGMNSHNHPMYGSVGAWFYRRLAGIRLDAGAAAFSDVVIDPITPPGLPSVAATIATIRGDIGSEWTRSDGEIELTIRIPPGCSARVRLPRADGVVESRVREGLHTFRWPEPTATATRDRGREPAGTPTDARGVTAHT